jgi:hypothetical protein
MKQKKMSRKQKKLAFNDIEKQATWTKTSKLEKGGFCSLILGINWLFSAFG